MAAGPTFSTAVTGGAKSDGFSTPVPGICGGGVGIGVLFREILNCEYVPDPSGSARLFGDVSPLSSWSRGRFSEKDGLLALVTGDS